ncbi:Ras-GEF domain-containing protein [Entamoeba marina]
MSTDSLETPNIKYKKHNHIDLDAHSTEEITESDDDLLFSNFADSFQTVSLRNIRESLDSRPSHTTNRDLSTALSIGSKTIIDQNGSSYLSRGSTAQFNKSSQHTFQLNTPEKIKQKILIPFLNMVMKIYLITSESTLIALKHWHGDEDNFYSTISDLNNLIYNSFLLRLSGQLRELIISIPKVVPNSFGFTKNITKMSLSSNIMDNQNELIMKYCLSLLEIVKKPFDEQLILNGLLDIDKGKHLLALASQNLLKTIPDNDVDCALTLIFLLHEFEFKLFTTTLPETPLYDQDEISYLQQLVLSFTTIEKALIEGLLDIEDKPTIVQLAFLGLFTTASTAMDKTNCSSQVYGLYHVLKDRRGFIMEGIVNEVSYVNNKINLCTPRALLKQIPFFNEKMLTIVCEIHSLIYNSEDFMNHLKSHRYYHCIEVFNSVFKEIDSNESFPSPVSPSKLADALVLCLNDPRDLAKGITNFFSTALTKIQPTDFVIGEGPGACYYIRCVDEFQQALCIIIEKKPTLVKDIIRLGKHLLRLNNFEGAGAVGLAISFKCTESECKKLNSKYRKTLASLAKLFRTRNADYTSTIYSTPFPKIPVYAFSKNIVETSKAKPTFCEFYPNYVDFGGKCLPIGEICYLYEACKKNTYSSNAKNKSTLNCIQLWKNSS